jgi:hypothetical protein
MGLIDEKNQGSKFLCNCPFKEAPMLEEPLSGNLESIPHEPAPQPNPNPPMQETLPTRVVAK